MANVLVMTMMAVTLLAQVAAAEVIGARIFYACDGIAGCQVREIDLYEKVEVDARIGEARDAVAALEARVRELNRQVAAQQQAIDALRRQIERR